MKRLIALALSFQLSALTAFGYAPPPPLPQDDHLESAEQAFASQGVRLVDKNGQKITLRSLMSNQAGPIKALIPHIDGDIGLAIEHIDTKEAF